MYCKVGSYCLKRGLNINIMATNKKRTKKISLKFDKACYWLYFIVNRRKIGSISIVREDNDIMLCSFRLESEYRGLGFEKRAFEMTIDFIKITFPDACNIELLVNNYNNVAISIYQSCGFVFYHNYGDYSKMKLKLK